MEEIICKKPKMGPSPDFPHLEASVEEFDVNIISDRKYVVGIVGNKKYLCIVSSAEISGGSNLWNLELTVLKPLNQTRNETGRH